MSSRGARSLLDRLAAEVRAQRAPEPAEPGLPPRLRAEFRSAASGLGSGPPAARPAAARRWWPALGLAAAAALGLLLARSGGWAPESQPPAGVVGGSAAAAPIAVLDGQALEVGVLVVAADRPRHVEHAGRASWDLAPGSQARLLSAAGGVLRVSLEQGSLVAEVEPSRQPESFVVQARGTEVAVHGTHFIVSVLGERVHVAVTRGQVQVRPVVSARAVLPTSGTLLAAGMQADFWAGATEPPAPSAPRDDAPAQRAAEQPSIAPQGSHGARPARPGTPASGSSAAKLSEPAVPSAASPTAPSAAASAASPSAVASAASLSAVPSAAATAAPSPGARSSGAAAPAPPAASVEQALETVTGHVQRCFREQLRGSSELGIEASTRLGLWVEPDGELLRADFDPPLAPAVESCVAAQLAHLRVAPSPAGFRVEREIRLRR